MAQLFINRKVGRGEKQGLYNAFEDQLSQNAKKDQCHEKTNDGFFIANEDLKIRGFGDLIGYQQSGIKNFRFVDPELHSKFFEIVHDEISRTTRDNFNISKFKHLLKIYDKTEVLIQKEN